MNRTRIFLLLLIALCVAVIYAWVATPTQRKIVAGQGSVLQTKGQHQQASPSTIPAVDNLDFSAGGETPYKKPQKNLFAPLYLPPQVVRSSPPPRPVAKVTKPIAKPQKVVVTAAPQQGPKPIQPLNVLGYLSKQGETTVFLSAQQGNIFLVKKGDTFAGDLVVHSISDHDITIGRQRTEQQVVLKLGKAKSQRLPNVKFRSNRPEYKMPEEPKVIKPNPFKQNPFKQNPFRPKSVENHDQNNKKTINGVFK